MVSFGLNLYDFYLQGTLKQKVHRSKPHTIEELKENITMEVFFISQEEFRCVNVNFMEVSGMHAG
jgi:hypothetical protein